jgi:hypothetical protein
MPTAKRSKASAKRSAAKKTSAKAAAEAEPVSPPDDTGAQPAAAAASGSAGGAKRVLLVDDHAEFVESMRTVPGIPGNMKSSGPGPANQVLAWPNEDRILILLLMYPKRAASGL